MCKCLREAISNDGGFIYYLPFSASILFDACYLYLTIVYFFRYFAISSFFMFIIGILITNNNSKNRFNIFNSLYQFPPLYMAQFLFKYYFNIVYRKIGL